MLRPEGLDVAGQTERMLEPESDPVSPTEVMKTGLTEEILDKAEKYIDNPPPPTQQSPVQKAIDKSLIGGPEEDYKVKISKLTPEGRGAIRGMISRVLGKEFNGDLDAFYYCTTFVSDMLNSIGADPLKDKGDEYNRTRANAYMKYGTPVDIEDIQEGDIVIFDFPKLPDGSLTLDPSRGKRNGLGDHATFYAGDRLEVNKPGSDFIGVLGGEQGGGAAISMKDFDKSHILGIRRIQYNNIDYNFTKEMSKVNPEFNKFLDEQAKQFDFNAFENQFSDPIQGSNRLTSSFDEGGIASKALDFLTSPLTGDYRKEKPTSVQMAEAGLDFTPVGTVDSIVEDPSWSNIALEVAPDLLGLGPAKRVGQSLIKGFKTKKGSTYEVKEGNTTVRDKAARPEHPGESGIQPQSVKTIYMPRSELEKFGGVHQNPDIPTEFIPTGSDTAALRLTEDWGPLKAGEILPETEVKFTLDPEVGLNPVEILDFRSPRGIHFGNEITEVMDDIWSYPDQLYDSAETSINVSKKPAGYNELKKRGEIKDGDLIVDIGGGKFDNLVDDAAEQGATVKVYDPFNRSPEHNKDVVESVRDGKADMAMSHNVLNVIQEDKNIIDIAKQAENAVKPGGKAHFSVYEGTGKGEGKVTTKGYQRNQKTQDYIPLIEEVFGKGNVTRKGKIITATKKETQGFNQGGPVMQEQMEMAFMQEGGIKDDGMKRDPVSGNEIPPGSMASEVRDDIPAMLSEGEYVIPADVLRFYGVNFFEGLRNKAKSGLQNMEANGRIGGEPLSPDQVQQNMSGQPQAGAPARMPVAANTGPYMAGQPQGLQQAQGMSQNFNPMNYGVVGGSTLGGGQQQESITTFKTYVNAETGENKVLEYINGQLKNKSDEQYTVPPYYLFGSAALKKAQKAASQPISSGNEDGGEPPTPSNVDPNEWAKDITNPEAWADEKLQGKANSILSTIELATSVARVNAMAIVAEAQGNTVLADNLRDKAREFTANNPVLNSLPNAWIDGDKIAEDLQKDKDRAKNLFGMKTEEQKKFGLRAEQRKAEQRAKAAAQAKADKAAAKKALESAQRAGDDDDPFRVSDVSIDRDPMGNATMSTTYGSGENASTFSATADEIDPSDPLGYTADVYRGGLMTRKRSKKKK